METRASERQILITRTTAGGAVARFAGQNVHKRLVKEESYRNQDWSEAMRRAFLGTDEDMLAGALRHLFRLL